MRNVNQSPIRELTGAGARAFFIVKNEIAHSGMGNSYMLLCGDRKLSVFLSNDS